MAALFAFSAILQLNDPDPLQWMAIYLAAAGLAAMAAANYEPPWRRPVALAAVAVACLWAIVIAFGSPELPPFTALLGDWEMQGAGIEERRETLGLLLLALWTTVVAVTTRPRATAHRRRIP